MGTRFMATKECRGHPGWKEWLVNATEADTTYIMKSIKNPSRVVKNVVAAKVAEMENRGATLEELLPIIAGQGGAVFDDGKIDSQLASAGQAVGLIHDVPTVKELIDRIVEEAIQIRERLNAAIGSA
jgi:NAD(P)H-dependent flavin oxidoreductase YrpB (nitropropane dioxygenase family)